MEFSQSMKQYMDLLNAQLELRVALAPQLLQGSILEAMRYSLLAGGKRIRPILTLEFCRAAGGDVANALPFACAIEMIHTYSLIHDDLPCMDNDDYRRGRLTNHKVYGEAMAVLAGDALLNFAFETALSATVSETLTPDRILLAAKALADFSGIYGMIGGQIIDIEGENMSCGLDRIVEMDRCKTAALMRASVKMGCLVAGATEKQLAAADQYAENMGIAFQIEDDILDVTGDFQKLGKQTGSDEKSKKNTYVSLLGLEQAKQMAADLTQKALSALDAFDDTAFLQELANMLLHRES